MERPKKKTTKKTGAKKSVKPSVKKYIDKDDIFVEIGKCCDSMGIEIITSYGREDFGYVVIAKSVELTVNRVKNQSIFQPYESNNIEKYCLLSIIQVKGVYLERTPKFVDSLLDIDCPVYKIARIEEVNRVLDGIGK